MSGWLDKHPDLDLRRTVVRGHAGKILVDESRGAQLLVVGARGRGGFRGLRIGSVGQAAIHHAHCPVAVVHHQR